ncbi:MAG: hypothetical protein K9N23_16575 [Akkermansiaceae bacterium]|nr:hypothetical protein [Akkermansiaceae bacterium]
MPDFGMVERHDAIDAHHHRQATAFRRCCVFLVDLGCLGPKAAFVTQFRTRAEYESEFRQLMMGQHPMILSDYPLAVKIILESLKYAKQLGFKVPPPVHKTLGALGSLEVASGCQQEIPLGGTDGLPYYMAGPDDDVVQILATLNHTCGPGKFHFTTPASPFPQGFFD